jgi:hypothetical protein
MSVNHQWESVNMLRHLQDVDNNGNDVTEVQTP